MILKMAVIDKELEEREYEVYCNECRWFSFYGTVPNDYNETCNAPENAGTYRSRSELRYKPRVQNMDNDCEWWTPVK